MAIFSVNTTRFDPYKVYPFLVYFGTSTTAVAAVSKVTALKRTSAPIDYNEGGYGITIKGLGRTTYEPVTLSRGITFDSDFETWANAAQVVKSGAPSTSLANLRKNIRIVLLNEASQPVRAYKLSRCWVSEYEAMPDLDASQNGIAIEYIKIVYEGFERDASVTEVKET
jgi:phage tail-like protein